MPKTKRLLLLVAAVLGLVVLSAGIAVAAGGSGEPTSPAAVSDDGASDENEATEQNDGGEGETDGAPLSGASADKAAEAALATTGGGRVLAVESDDDGAGYEVEIRKSDGSEAEVELDESFGVTQRSEDD